MEHWRLNYIAVKQSYSFMYDGLLFNGTFGIFSAANENNITSDRTTNGDQNQNQNHAMIAASHWSRLWLSLTHWLLLNVAGLEHNLHNNQLAGRLECFRRGREVRLEYSDH